MFNQTEFAARRQKLMAQLPADSIALVKSAPEVYRNGDTHYSYRQNSDFYYLTGLKEPDAVALFIPQRAAGEFILFNRAKDPSKEIWTGYYAGTAGAIATYGADQAFPISELNALMPALLTDKRCVYYLIGRDVSLDQLVMQWVHELQQQIRSGTSAPTELINLETILHELRLFKSPAELAIMRQAAAISATAHCKAMHICRADMMEYQLQAAIEYDFKNQGMVGPAYGTIVGSGKNACILHYVDNDSALVNGDLVLIDAGCENAGYSADITRTFPVNGKFSPAQSALYNVVLQAQLAVIDLIKPGTAYDELQNTARLVLTEGLVSLGILSGIPTALVEEKAYLPFYMHNIGHWLGLDTHDVGGYKVDKQWRKLEPSMVLTVEPGLYIAPDNTQVEAQWRGLGIRIEDDILVTNTGYEILSAGVPKTIQEIEALCTR